MYQMLTIIGRLGKDPELRYTPTGTPVCTFNVATDRVWNNDQGVPTDPWGAAYAYKRPGTKGEYDIVSLGKDSAPWNR